MAQEFAKALKLKTRRGDGYLESDEAIVTWCVGHLVTMSYPEAYDPALKKWSLQTLPFIPEEFKYEVIPNVAKQFQTVSFILNREDVDTIYVALPNHLHYGFAKKALLAGKHVILEKPGTSNAAQMRELEKLAAQEKKMLLEAMNIHYLPVFQSLKEHLKDLGTIKIVSLNYSQYSSRYDAFRRGEVLAAFDPKRAGGALMDLNVYNIHAAVGLFGKPESVRYEANVEREIDTSGILTMDYGSFKVSSIGAKDCKAPVRCTIQGTEGCIVIAKPVNQMESFELILNDGTTAEYKTEHPEHRLYYEFVEFQKMMETEDWERHDQMLAVSLAAAEILE